MNTAATGVLFIFTPNFSFYNLYKHLLFILYYANYNSGNAYAPRPTSQRSATAVPPLPLSVSPAHTRREWPSRLSCASTALPVPLHLRPVPRFRPSCQEHEIEAAGDCLFQLFNSLWTTGPDCFVRAVRLEPARELRKLLVRLRPEERAASAVCSCCPIVAETLGLCRDEWRVP